MTIDEAVARLTALHPQSEQYRSVLAQLLAHLDPYQPFGTALFNALARLTWSVAFEAGVFRLNPESGKVEVFLRRRADDDSAYPGEWHVPGSVFRPGENERRVADRLAQEFGAAIVLYHYAGDFVDWESGEARGSFLSRNYLVGLSGEARVDERHNWFPVDCLPEKTCQHHRDYIIPMMAKTFSINRSFGR